MDKTDLSLILSALGVLIALHVAVVAALIITAFVGGTLVGATLTRPP